MAVANTWRAYAPTVPFGTSAGAANIFNLINATGSGVILRIYRVLFLNVSISAVTGVFCFGTLRRYAASTWNATGSTTITPVPYYVSNTALPAQVTCYRTPTNAPSGGSSVILSKYAWQSEEITWGTQALQGLMAYTQGYPIWNYCYGFSSTIQPLVVREDQAFSIVNATGAAGSVHIFVDFTSGAS